MKNPFKITYLDEWKDAFCFRLVCDCGSNYCDTDFFFEIDEESGVLQLFITSELHTHNHYLEGRFKKYILRVISAIKLLFTGRIEIHHDVIVKGGDHIDSLINALIEAKNKLS